MIVFLRQDTIQFTCADHVKKPISLLNMKGANQNAERVYYTLNAAFVL